MNSKGKKGTDISDEILAAAGLPDALAEPAVSSASELRELDNRLLEQKLGEEGIIP